MAKLFSADDEKDKPGGVGGRSGREVLETFMRTGTRAEAASFVERIFESIGEEDLRSMIFLMYTVMDMVYAMVRFLQDMGHPADEIDRICGPADALFSGPVDVSKAREYLTSYLSELIRIRDESSGGMTAGSDNSL